MKAFEPYVRHLELLAESAKSLQSCARKDERVLAALDGEPAKKLRSLVRRDDLRSVGAFFTGTRLADRACGPLLSKVSEKAVIADVACGAGDLLVSCARRLPLGNDLRSTLGRWGQQLIGLEHSGAIFGPLLAEGLGCRFGPSRTEPNSLLPQVEFLAEAEDGFDHPHFVL